MTRLEKELRKHGIIHESDIRAVMMGPEYDEEERFVAISGNYLITIWCNEVLDPILKIYDRKSFTYLGNQLLYPDDDEFPEAVFHNRWNSGIAFADCDLF